MRVKRVIGVPTEIRGDRGEGSYFQGLRNARYRIDCGKPSTVMNTRLVVTVGRWRLASTHFNRALQQSDIRRGHDRGLPVVYGEVPSPLTSPSI